MKKNLFKSFFVTTLVSLIVPGFALAASSGLVPCKGTDCDFCKLLQLVLNIINFIAKTLAPAVAGLLVVVGGIMYLLAGSNPSFIGRARGILLNVVVGLVIIYVSYLIVYTILNVLASNTAGFTISGWSSGSLNCP